MQSKAIRTFHRRFPIIWQNNCDNMRANIFLFRGKENKSAIQRDKARTLCWIRDFAALFIKCSRQKVWPLLGIVNILILQWKLKVRWVLVRDNHERIFFIFLCQDCYLEFHLFIDCFVWKSNPNHDIVNAHILYFFSLERKGFGCLIELYESRDWLAITQKSFVNKSPFFVASRSISQWLKVQSRNFFVSKTVHLVF